MFERLLELGKSVLAERDLDRMLTAAIDGVIQLCRAERGMILLFDPEGKLVFEVARNLRQEDLERPELQVSRTILEKVRAEGRPFWHPNVLDDPEVGHSDSVLRLMILSVICQPIRDLGRTLGVIYLDNRSAEGMFTEETARLVESFTELVSLAVRNAMERRHLNRHIGKLSKELRTRFDFQAIVGKDPKMLEVLKLVSQVADSEATVLIRGESGTGKELIARALHLNSRRRDKPFVPVNCGALPETLLESELFGHVRGAFTGAVRDHPGWFERAEGGTLLLDEVGELPPALQVKLLRVLENGEYSRVGSTQIRHASARIVAATNRDLEELALEGKMRRDFLYRLNVVEIRLPSLRERRSDLPLLIRRLIDQHAGRREPKRLTPDAERLLLSYDYPGNIRELQNFLQRAVLLSEGDTIEVSHLPETLHGLRPSAPAAPEPDKGEGLLPGEGFRAAKQRMVERFEREYIGRCLSKTRGNISQAARLAQIDYKNFYIKMQQYGIEAAKHR
ncbi:MAG TPA: sigma 54-interacting transcriptional regulator [Thermoanaerobaculia bacterium]|nr:sigma 54-interacting transcriptional regulator [Thermoanaerobaculia bacterium]